MKLCLIALCASLGLGCGSWQANQATLASALYATAHGVKAADEVCAIVAERKNDKVLAEKCVTAYKVARSSLIAAENALLSASYASDSDVLCAVASALKSLVSVGDVLKAASVEIPPYAAQALSLAMPLSALCSGAK